MIKRGMLFNRGVSEHLSSCFDNSPFLSGVEGKNQEPMCWYDSVSHVFPFQRSGMFSIRKKNEKNKTKTTQLFLFHLDWAVCPFVVAMTTAAFHLLHLDLFPN